MSTEVEVVALDLPLPQLVDRFDQTHHHGFPVVNSNQELVGVVTIRDVDRALALGTIEEKTVSDIATTTGLLVAYPDDPMRL